MATEYQQINTNIDAETVELLDIMTREDGDVSRSAFFRRLIRQEYARRYSQPNPLVTIEQAQAAAEDCRAEKINP